MLPEITSSFTILWFCNEKIVAERAGARHLKSCKFLINKMSNSLKDIILTWLPHGMEIACALGMMGRFRMKVPVSSWHLRRLSSRIPRTWTKCPAASVLIGAPLLASWPPQITYLLLLRQFSFLPGVNSTAYPTQHGGLWGSVEMIHVSIFWKVCTVQMQGGRHGRHIAVLV